MAHLLAYWKIFWNEQEWHRDAASRQLTLLAIKESRRQNGYGFEHRNVQSQIAEGENLWVIGRGAPPRMPHHEEWRLLLRVCVGGFRTDSSIRLRPFVYRIQPRNFDLFDPFDQPDLAPLLKRLEFASGKKIPTDVSGGAIGKYLRHARPLLTLPDQDDDNRLLIDWIGANKLRVV